LFAGVNTDQLTYYFAVLSEFLLVVFLAHFNIFLHPLFSNIYLVVLPTHFPLFFTLNLLSFFCFVEVVIIIELKMLDTFSP